MFNPYEMFAQAQGGAAFDNLARAYGMSAEQMRAAVSALTPAFAQGFQRQAQSDEAARRFAGLFGAETYARAFEAQAAALDPAAKAAGDDALGALFGSKEVSRAVAAQAAAASGVQAEIIRKVLPVLTSILIGGFMKAAQGAAQASPAAPPMGFPGPVGAFWDQALRGGKGAQAGAAENPFQDWMGAFGPKPAGDEPRGSATGNPMGDMVADMLNGMFGGPAAKPAEAPQEAPRPEEPAEGTPFDQMVRTGREMQTQNARAMEQIFEAFFGGQPPKR